MEYTPQQQRELAARYQQARKAGQAEASEVLAELLASVDRLARMLASERHTPGLTEWDDLFSDAQVALLEAAVTYDPDGDIAFGTYVAGVLRHSLNKSLRRARQARHGGSVPAAWSRVQSQAATASYKLEQKLGRKPTRAELREDLTAWAERWALGRLTAEQRKLPAGEQLAEARRILTHQGTTGAIRQLDQVLLAGQRPAQLDQVHGDNWTLAETLAAGDASPELAALAAVGNARVRAVLADLRAELTPYEQRLLDNMMADEPVSVTELARDWPVSRQQASNYLARLEARLRHPLMLRRLLAASA